MSYWEIRYALRLMRRNPGFTMVAVLSLALGIGANTAIFSLVDAIILRQMPVERPEQLVEFLQKRPGEPRTDDYMEWSSYEHFRNNNHVLSELTGVSFDNLATIRTEGSESETVTLENVLGNYFRVLGLKPAIGRLIGPEDVPANGVGQVAVVSWAYWNRRFRGDPAILGKRILVSDEPMTIIGVAPKAYTGPRVGVRTDIWIPYERDQVRMLGRLKDDVTLEQAQSEMAVLYQFTLQQRAAKDRDPRIWQTKIEVERAGAGFARVRDQYGKPLVLLMAVVGLLLLLACSNVASMLLAQAAARRREIAVRVGLGAGPGRLMRQMLTESLMLSAAGTLVGLVLAYFATRLLVQILASGREAEQLEIQVQPDLNLLLFAAAITAITGLLFGLAPAWYAFRTAPVSCLRQSGQGSDAPVWRLFEKGLVAAQVAVSVLLVSTAALFLGHVSRLRNLDLGFRSDHVLLMAIDTTRSGYQRAQLAAPFEQLMSRLENIAGVRSAAISGCTPIQRLYPNSRMRGYAFCDRGRIYGASRASHPHFAKLGVAALLRNPRDTVHRGPRFHFSRRWPAACGDHQRSDGAILLPTRRRYWEVCANRS